MLPLLDRPAIQYVVEEAVASGCDDILIITGRTKRAIEDHFDLNIELEHYASHNGSGSAVRSVQEIAGLADIHFIRQKEPLGLGHAVYQARKHVGDEPFAVLLGDDITFSKRPCTAQLIEGYEETRSSVVAVEHIPSDRATAYGVVDIEPMQGRLARIRGLVEKPAPSDAPSDLGILGRYVLTPGIFEALRRTRPGAKGEIQLTDALHLLRSRESVYAYAFEGRRFDLGNKMDWLKTNVEVALMREDYRDELLRFLEDIVLHRRQSVEVVA
jgi:UTP--glucose-1-phosphate uridylyltransferase